MWRRWLASALLVGLVAVGALALVIHNRVAWVLDLGDADGDLPRILPSKPPLAPGAEWFDDWYALERIDPGTVAIGEPRYWQQNYSYLLLGEERAVLFDTGPGIRDIRPIVEALTDLPVVVIASHYHYDHVGGHENFPVVALADLPELRRLVTETGEFTPSPELHLGDLEDLQPPTHRVAEWWPPGKRIDLGARELLVLHTPGHTRDSISLYDAARRQLFCGDYLYPDQLYAFVPGSHMGDYLQTAQQLLSILDADTLLYPAHSVPSEAGYGLARLDVSDVADLRDALLEIRAGKRESDGWFPRRYRVNDVISLLADFEWLQAWD